MTGLKRSLILLGGLCAGTSAAQDVQWRPATTSPPGATLGRPVPLGRGAMSSPAALLRPAAPSPVIRLVKADEPAGIAKGEPAPKEWRGAPRPSPVLAPEAVASADAWGSYAHDPAFLPPAPEAGPPAPLVVAPAVDGGPGLVPYTRPYYFRGEYLMWWTKGMRLPPLVTTGPPASLGFLDDARTTLLFGGDTANDGLRSGGRFTLGGWCDDERTFGAEASFFFLGQRSAHFFAGSDAFPLLARPFFSLNRPGEFSELVTAPGLAVGGVEVDTPSRLWGVETNLLCNWCCGCFGRFDVLSGSRYLDLNEGLHVTESVTSLVPTSIGPAGTRAVVHDRFDTRNQFWGGQVGLAWEGRRGPWSLDLRAKVALGVTRQTVTTLGSQLFLTPPPEGLLRAAAGGLLALDTNSGRYQRDRFSVVPEVGVTLGYDVTEWWRLTVGYSFLYWSSVVRPGDQVDRVLDVTRIPNFPLNPPAVPTGQARPAPTFRDTDFWAQGINFGMEFRW